MLFFVNRQAPWGETDESGNTRYYVEIAKGGIDYANADMLGEKWPELGEGEEFEDPREAVKAAIAVRDAWAEMRGVTQESISVSIGYTGGHTIPFEDMTDEEVIAKAAAIYEKLPKCDQCGAILPNEVCSWFDYPDFKFCQEYCAEQFIAGQETEEE